MERFISSTKDCLYKPSIMQWYAWLAIFRTSFLYVQFRKTANFKKRNAFSKYDITAKTLIHRSHWSSLLPHSSLLWWSLDASRTENTQSLDWQCFNNCEFVKIKFSDVTTDFYVFNKHNAVLTTVFTQRYKVAHDVVICSDYNKTMPN